MHNGIFRVANNNPFNSPPEAVEVTKAFIQHYFTLYDTNRQQLSTLYRNNSCLSQEGTNCGGPQQIMERLTTLPSVKHDGNSLTVDVQCVNGIEILFMFISGQVRFHWCNFSATLDFARSSLLKASPTLSSSRKCFSCSRRVKATLLATRFSV